MSDTSRALSGDGLSERATVVVSVYNARQATRACVESLLRHTDTHHRILIVDDASTDAEMAPMLEAFAVRDPRIEVRRHPVNLGYTATINEGCQWAGRDDVVLLNSDTVVARSWLEKLRTAASSRPLVATVTPVSNAAGAFSVPIRSRVNKLPRGISIDRMAHLVEELSERLYPEVPTGNGFCLYIRRTALDAVGSFDAERFPRGCGEENDFCMRAFKMGFVHLIDDSNFIYHELSASLGWRKRWLLWQTGRKLRLLHPSYEQQINRWLANDPLAGLRTRLLDSLRKTLGAGRLGDP